MNDLVRFSDEASEDFSFLVLPRMFVEFERRIHSSAAVYHNPI
jgi:hypothetical protein